jgi:hypothetical protein
MAATIAPRCVPRKLRTVQWRGTRLERLFEADSRAGQLHSELRVRGRSKRLPHLALNHLAACTVIALDVEPCDTAWKDEKVGKRLPPVECLAEDCQPIRLGLLHAFAAQRSDPKVALSNVVETSL